MNGQDIFIRPKGGDSPNRIACCFMTHNHPLVITDVLECAQKLYSDCGIDMVYCDDSDRDDGQTKEIILKYIEDGADNLYYVDASVAEDAHDKYLRIIKKEFLPKDYDYIWPCKDRSFFMPEVLVRLAAAAEEGMDLIMMLNPFDREELDWPLDRDTYTDPVMFFRDYGQLVTNWEGMVYNAGTMLDVPDWEPLEKQYGLGCGCSFIQPITVFTRLSQIKDPKIKIIFATGDSLLYSPHAHSDWGSNIFSVWVDDWVPAIFSLPSIYDPYKALIVKKQTNLWALFGGMDRILVLENDGLLTKEVFDKYRQIWPIISDIPAEHVDMLLDGKAEILLNGLVQEFLDTFVQHDLEKAYFMYIRNRWMQMAIGDEDYEVLGEAIRYYQRLRILRKSTEELERTSNCREFMDAYLEAKKKEESGTA